MIKAVIFDMDGVISDTLPLHSEAESQALACFGIKMTPQEIIDEFNAIPDRIMFETILSRHKSTADINIVIAKKWEIMKKLAENNIRPIKGVIDLITTLNNNHLALGVASSTSPYFINLVLTTLHIKNYFKAVTSTEEVQNGKPNPDIFLLTAKKICVQPSECIVIEDATNGIRAAKAASMKCIAITTTHKREDLKDADRIVDSLSELTISTLNNL